MKKIKAQKIQLVGISYDKVSILKKFSDKAKLSYPLLSDLDSKTIKAYGIHNKGGLPHPTTFVVNQDGTIHARLKGTVYQRHTTAELLKSLKKK